MKACQCFCIKCDEEISSEKWDEAKHHLTEHELKAVQSYVFRKDQERTLLSMLLQKFVIRKYLSVISSRPDIVSLHSRPLENRLFRIARSRENKPYLVVKSSSLKKMMDKAEDTFNYNVSHHGSFVGIVAHDKILVGMDIVDVTTRATWVDDLQAYVDIYRKQLSDEEVQSIMTRALLSEEEGYTHFYVLWSLKEAYVKAVGVGIGINLKNVAFDVSYLQDSLECTQRGSLRGTAVLRQADALPVSDTDHPHGADWHFQFFSLDDKHVMTVARGKTASALQSFREAAWPQLSPAGSVDGEESRNVGVSAGADSIRGDARCEDEDPFADSCIERGVTPPQSVCDVSSTPVSFPTFVTINDLLII